MENFDRFFLHDRKVFLDNISYETQPVAPSSGDMQLNCKDTVLAQLRAGGIKVNFNRTLKFIPDGPFTLSVTFAVILTFDPSTKDEVDWKSLDIAGEFRKSCPALLSVMMSRASLMVAEITSAGGQNPLITPATPVQNQ